MRKRRFEPETNDVLAAGCHLTDQQLVDVVIGASSRAGEPAIEDHLASCSRCRDGLDNLRGVDRQLELGGGSRRLAAIPGMAPPLDSAPGDSVVAVPWATASGWHRVAVPLMAAACALFALQAAVKMSRAPALILDRGAEVAESSVAPLRPVSPPWGPSGTARFYCREAPSLPADVTAAPAVVEVAPPAVALVKRIDDSSGRSRGLSRSRLVRPRVRVVTPRQASNPSVREDIVSGVMSERHPGASRGDDKVSSPPKQFGV